MADGRRKPDWCESRVDLPSYPDTLYRRASRQMMYVKAKFPHWCPDFRRVAVGFAVAITSQRLDLLDIVQYLHLAASDFAMRFDNGRLHVYARGSFGPSNCVPSEELLAICTEYACAVEGLALLARVGDCSGDTPPTPYEAADKVYLACAGADPKEPVSPISLFSKIRDAAKDHGRGKHAPSGEQARIAVANCRIHGKAMRNMLVSGRIFTPYETYMAPEGCGSTETFAVSIDTRAMRRFFGHFRLSWMDTHVSLLEESPSYSRYSPARI